MNLWEIYAHCYDSLLHLIPYRRLVEKMLYLLDLGSGDYVLDIGCGTGNLEYLNDISGVSFSCLDYSSQMLKRAKRKNPQCSFKKYNILKYNLPFSDNCFNKAAVSNVLYIVKDLSKFFLDLGRVVSPGGYVVITTSVRDGFAPVVKEHFREISPIVFLKNLLFLPQFLVVVIINILIDRSDEHLFHSEESVIKSLEESGFKVISNEMVYGGINTIIKAQKVV